MIKKLNKQAASVLIATVLSIGTMFTPSASEAAPCSCWDAGTIGCHNSNIGGCSRCWAAWDTGLFSPNFQDHDLKKILEQVEAFKKANPTIEQINQKIAELGKSQGLPMEDIRGLFEKGAAYLVGGINAMEVCRKACQTAKAKHNRKVPYGTDQVWWYADATALQSCKNYQKWYNAQGTANPRTIDIINKYQYR